MVVAREVEAGQGVDQFERDLRAAVVEAWKPTAYEFHRALAANLESRGWEIRTEWLVESRGTPDGQRGRIDIVVPGIAAIEVDRITPRVKSLVKLRQFHGARYVVLREGHSPLELPLGINAVIGCNTLRRKY